MLKQVGEYVFLMVHTFRKPEKWSVYWKQLFQEFINLGVDSLGIAAIISVFTGGIIAIQTASNIDSPLIPLTMIGFTTRQTMVLEFSPTIISLILAGKVGSRIASEIGTMQVTEQIDALKIMGINPPNHLLLPKVVAAMLINPVLIVYSIAQGLFGGWLACIVTGIVSTHDYVAGLNFWFEPFTVFYALIKTVVFAFIITSVSGFQGYKTKGGAIEVGRSSTRGVVHSSILIIIFDLILTQMLLV
ncbi:MAG: MlaE family ABC transporter permease [Hyphomicrobiales bacterium]